MNVNPTADNVPIGMLRPGLFNSPLILAPAMIPGRRANNNIDLCRTVSLLIMKICAYLLHPKRVHQKQLQMSLGCHRPNNPFHNLHTGCPSTFRSHCTIHNTYSSHDMSHSALYDFHQAQQPTEQHLFMFQTHLISFHSFAFE